MLQEKEMPIKQDDEVERQAAPRRWQAFALLMLPALLIPLNSYMVQIALPFMQTSLHADFSEAQFLLSSYSLGLAAALILGGRLGDIYGRKRMLVVGVLGFTITAAVGGVLSHAGALTVTRIIQGMAAAIVQPQVLSIMRNSFHPKERGLAFGIYGAVIGVGFILGLTLGGLLIDWNWFGLGWRTVFFVNVPIGMLVLLLLPIVPEQEGNEKRQRHTVDHLLTKPLRAPVDWFGGLLLLSGLALLLYQLTEGQHRGWSGATWGSLATAVLILAAFTLKQLSRKKQGKSFLIDFDIFRSRLFSTGIAAVMLIYLSMFSFFVLLNYYVQAGLHYTIRSSSFVFLPLGGGFFLASLLTSRFTRKRRAILQIGTVMMGLCSVLLIQALHADAIHLFHNRHVLILFGYGCGLGMATTPLANLVLGTVPQQDAGTGAGLFSTSMYFASALGVAFSGMMFSHWLGHTLIEAEPADYVRAFSISISASGGIALAGGILLCFLREEGA
ncbi:MFS transporter [Paenibacillus contaminans]|nr:MFS transporter [Paenibacillus contaminans]